MENKNDLANTLYELMKEFTKCFNNIYPHLRCNVYYDNMYNHILENSNYHGGGYHVTDEFAAYFKGYYSQFSSYRFAMDISEKNIKVVEKAIKEIKKLKAADEREICENCIHGEQCYDNEDKQHCNIHDKSFEKNHSCDSVEVDKTK